MLDDLPFSSQTTEFAHDETAPRWAPDPEATTAEFEAVSGRLDGALRDHGDQRREPRYRAIENKLWMEWWEGEEYLGRTARLVNVSRHGAMIVSWALLKEHQRVRICLEESAPQVSVNATVLGVVEGVSGMHQIRLRFDGPCPDDFFEAAANGFESWLACKRSIY